MTHLTKGISTPVPVKASNLPLAGLYLHESSVAGIWDEDALLALTPAQRELAVLTLDALSLHLRRTAIPGLTTSFGLRPAHEEAPSCPSPPPRT